MGPPRSPCRFPGAPTRRTRPRPRPSLRWPASLQAPRQKRYDQETQRCHVATRQKNTAESRFLSALAFSLRVLGRLAQLMIDSERVASRGQHAFPRMINPMHLTVHACTGRGRVAHGHSLGGALGPAGCRAPGRRRVSHPASAAPSRGGPGRSGTKRSCPGRSDAAQHAARCTACSRRSAAVVKVGGGVGVGRQRIALPPGKRRWGAGGDAGGPRGQEAGGPLRRRGCWGHRREGAGSGGFAAAALARRRDQGPGQVRVLGLGCGCTTVVVRILVLVVVVLGSAPWRRTGARQGQWRRRRFGALC